MSHESRVGSHKLGALTQAQQTAIARRLTPLFDRIDLEIPAQRDVALEIRDMMVAPIVGGAEAMR